MYIVPLKYSACAETGVNHIDFSNFVAKYLCISVKNSAFAALASIIHKNTSYYLQNELTMDDLFL